MAKSIKIPIDNPTMGSEPWICQTKTKETIKESAVYPELLMVNLLLLNYMLI